MDGCGGCGEDKPDEVFVLPGGADTGDLEDEGAVVVEEIVYLTEERTVAADAHMLAAKLLNEGLYKERKNYSYLSHLERDDLGVVARAARDLAVVHA